MFVFLSGQDYPLRRPEEMADFFDSRPGLNFIETARLPWSIWEGNGGFERLTHYHFLIAGQRLEYPSKVLPGARSLRLLHKLCELALPKSRSLPSNVTYYGGFNWWNLTRETAESIFAYLLEHEDFAKTFRFTRSSDELFYQTLLMNMEKQPTIENNDLRCVFWDGRRRELPAVVRMEDFPEIEASGMLFIRKIHPQISLPLMDTIDRQLLGWSQ